MNHEKWREIRFRRHYEFVRSIIQCYLLEPYAISILKCERVFNRETG